MWFISLSRSNQFTAGHCVERGSEVCFKFSIKHARAVNRNVTEVGSGHGHICNLCLKDKCTCGAKSLQSCLTLCDPMDHSLPGSSVHGILHAKLLEVGCHAPLQGNLPDPEIESMSPMFPVLAGRFFTVSATCDDQFFRIFATKFGASLVAQ